MKTVKAKIKGTNAILEGCVCDDSFFVSVDHDTFERYRLDEVEICKDSLQVPETCKENTESFTNDMEKTVKVLALTWEDVYQIIMINSYMEVSGDFDISHWKDYAEEHCKEVLKRFKEGKK